MNTLLAFVPIGASLSALLLCGSQVQAAGIPDSGKFGGGTLACGGSHFSRLSGTELHRTAYVLRNFSGYATIWIRRVQLFDANGRVLFDFPTVELPASVKTELGPHETTQINTDAMLVEELGPDARPIQSHVEWSYRRAHEDIALNGSTVRTVRAADTGSELSRASSECKLIDYYRHRGSRQ